MLFLLSFSHDKRVKGDARTSRALCGLRRISMRIVVAIFIAFVVMVIIEAGIQFGLPITWFSLFHDSVPPADKAEYLGKLLESTWLLSAASALSGFIGTRIFVAIGHISKFRHVAIFAGIMSSVWLFGAESYWSGAIVAIMGLVFSLIGGYLGLQDPINESPKSGAPETGAP